MNDDSNTIGAKLREKFPNLRPLRRPPTMICVSYYDKALLLAPKNVVAYTSLAEVHAEFHDAAELRRLHQRARAAKLDLSTARKDWQFLSPAHGRLNLHFAQRIDAAIRLYRSGKVRHLLVSGDNHTADYDEPSDMREALVSAGVPANAITCDYAGFRTLDSVLRARSVFGLSRFTLVTEAFHCPRAVWIARCHGLDAVAFAAPDLGARWSLRVKIREMAARAWCALDLYLFHRKPKFNGPFEPIILA